MDLFLVNSSVLETKSSWLVRSVYKVFANRFKHLVSSTSYLAFIFYGNVNWAASKSQKNF